MTASADTVYPFSANLLDGRTVQLAEFTGRALLIVNTASKCGFTPQYEGLEQLYRRLKDRGLVVLGFPCNQFGAQEPGTSEEIESFCRRNYDVTFPMFARICVNGVDAHPLFQFLKEQKPGFLGIRRISWNFTKFLVDRDGRVAGRFAPRIKPSALAPQIDRLLQRRSSAETS